MSDEFNAVATSPNYLPTVEELNIARGVLSGDIDDPTGGAVWFHSQDLDEGTGACAPTLIVENGFWKHFFYPIDACPGGPDPTIGCNKCDS